jgi:hypothetical protein
MVPGQPMQKKKKKERKKMLQEPGRGGTHLSSQLWREA